MMLEQELAVFEAHRQAWLQQHAGKYALVVGEDVLGFFDTAVRAYEIGLEARGNVPMLIKRVTEEDEPVRIPALLFAEPGGRV
ncbi:MAG: hypothetical protein ACOYXU_06195 [Nitrospirota bacterium]